jgi:hypothetical protein|tara:strand:- start:44 stop:304 length:261 start_codon:yes stop_codon:yes gene_type:complete
MTITKETIIAKTEIVGEYKVIQVAYDTIIKEDGIEISRSRSRNSFMPDVDVSSEDAAIKDIANVVWTDAVKASYQAKLDADEAARA